MCAYIWNWSIYEASQSTYVRSGTLSYFNSSRIKNELPTPLKMADVSFSESIDRLKESLLWAAAQGGNAQDCESLIQYGADVNWKNADGDTPLLAACRRGHTDTIELLLACGADSNVCGIDSLAPLHIATRRGDAESVNILLNANTSTVTRTKDGQTALDIARAKGYETIYARLMEKRTGVVRSAPANPPATTSNTLINNVRNELPSLLQNRPDSANASTNSGSIAPASRQLQSLGRLIQQAKNDYSDKRGNESTAANASPDITASSGSTSAARRRRHTQAASGGASLTSSVDSTGSGRGAWAGGEADSKADSDNITPTTSRAAEDAKFERQQKSSSSSSTKSSHLSNSATSATSSSQKGPNNSHSYSLMGCRNSHSDAGAVSGSVGGHNSGGVSMGGAEDPATTALRKILEQEKAARKALEMKLAVFKDQNTQLLQEFASLSQQLNEAQEEYGHLEHQLNRLLGEPTALEAASIDECEELERSLKTSLERVEAKKALLIRNQIGNNKEQRMCVVCQEHEKSVVLLPCRHLCLCDDCSTHDLLKICPLCREPIAHKISVFS